MTDLQQRNQQRLTGRIWWCLCLFLVALGLGASGLLLSRYFALLENRGDDSLNPCVVIGVGNCDEHLVSDAAAVLGIPVAGWGVMWFASLAWLLGVGLSIGREFRAHAAVGGCLLALAALFAQSFVFLTREIPVCPICLGVLAVNVALPFLAAKCTGYSFRELWQSIIAGVLFVCGRTEPNATNSWRALGFLSTLLVACTAFQWVFVQSEMRRSQPDDSERMVNALAEYVASPVHPQLLDSPGPRRGPAEAKAQFVVFSSFRCPACTVTAYELSLLREEFGERISITFSHFPLYADLYTKEEGQMISDPVLTVAVVAERDGNFWDCHDALYASSGAFDDESLQRITKGVGMDPVDWDDAELEAVVRERVTRDINLGIELEIDSTPSLFLNGQRIPRLDRHALRMLVLHELDGGT